MEVDFERSKRAPDAQEEHHNISRKRFKTHSQPANLLASSNAHLEDIGLYDKYADILESLPPVPVRVKRYSGVPEKNPVDTNDALTSEFTYSKDSAYLPLLEGEIRLLKVSAGTLKQPLNLGLLNVPLSLARNRYEALSYAWGTSPAAEPIVTKHASVKFGTHISQLTVTPRVLSILRHVRKRDQDVCLWIDSICIDQENNDEKGQQVRKMAEIYKSAEKVIVWLGESETDSEVQMSIIGSMLKPGFLSEREKRISAWHTVLHLMRSPWFSRIWVVQEIALAGQAVLCLGGQQINWGDFTDAFNLFMANKKKVDQDLRTLPGFQYDNDILSTIEHSGAQSLIKSLDFLRKNSRTGQITGSQQDLASLVTHYRSLEASDARDKIYALLGLASDEHSIQPDYTKSVLDVYADFVSYAIEQSSSLDIILRPWAPMRRPRKLDTTIDPNLQRSMPSWIPSFHDSPFGSSRTGMRTRVNANSLVGASRDYPYNATNGKAPQARMITQLKRESSTSAVRAVSSGILCVTGVILGTICDLSTRMADGIVLQECLEMGGFSLREGANIGNPPDRLWRTLVAGRDSRGHPISTLYRLAFINLFHQIERLRSIDTMELLDDESLDSYIQDFLRRVQEVVWNRRMFKGRHVLPSGVDSLVELFGLVPKEAVSGDYICLLYGASVPVVLREMLDSGNNVRYVNVGEAYVDGVMDGEAFEGPGGKMLEGREKTFALR